MKAKLDKREVTGLLFGLFACLLVVALLSYIPVGPRKKYLQSEVDLKSAQKQIKLNYQLKNDAEKESRQQEKIIEMLTARPENFDLFTYLTKTLEVSGLTDKAKLRNYASKAVSNSSAQPMVEVSLDGVSLEDVVKFLHEMYKNKQVVAMYKMDKLGPAKKGAGLECQIVFATVKLPPKQA